MRFALLMGVKYLGKFLCAREDKYFALLEGRIEEIGKADYIKRSYVPQRERHCW